MHDILEELLLLINEFPPAADHKSRFGNPAFRCWYGELSNRLYRFHRDALKIADEDIVECSAYLLNSFGNCERIDYGTGHEATFIAWLFCLHQCGLFDKQEFSAVVLFVFQKYLSVMRALQKTYWLEPAGSHGVWGLDDYHFLPFLFGAAQLSSFFIFNFRP